MPREEAIFGRQTRNAEYFDRLVGEQRCEDRCGCARVLQDERGHAHHASVGVAQWTIGADEFAHAVSASA
jgi:hypothetical protein